MAGGSRLVDAEEETTPDIKPVADRFVHAPVKLQSDLPKDHLLSEALYKLLQNIGD